MKDVLQTFLITLVTSVVVLFTLGPVMMKLNGVTGPAPAAPIPAAAPVNPAAPAATAAPKPAAAPVEATAPNVEGMLVKDARARWRDQGILIIEDRTRVDSTVKAGTILEQTPRAGAVIEQKELRVIVAIEAELKSVPNVVGEPAEDARAQLEKAGFKVSDYVSKASDQPNGTVLEQVPEPGTESEKGAEVRLTVAAELVEVPSLRNRRLSQARSKLEKAGLAVGKISEREDEELSGGRVLEQSPDAGERVAPGTTVDLTVVAPD